MGLEFCEVCGIVCVNSNVKDGVDAKTRIMMSELPKGERFAAGRCEFVVQLQLR